MTKFLGKIEDLQKLIADEGFEGEWEELPNHIYQFTSTDGAILNFYQNKTVQFQGAMGAKTAFEGRVAKLILEWKPVPKSTSLVMVAQPPHHRSAENKRVFVVHGHDLVAREQLELILHRLGLDPFVLANTGGGGLTLIEALEKEIGPQPGQCRFGIVLLTPDDMGYAKSQGPDKAEPRARQNVVLEMRMVLAALRRLNVVILKKGHLEIPSDVHGIIYIGFNDHVKETVPKLVERLNEAGFNLDATAIARATG
ncbi:MAG: TIR domain-containing protein [Limisphaerales bacterium]